MIKVSATIGVLINQVKTILRRDILTLFIFILTNGILTGFKKHAGVGVPVTLASLVILMGWMIG
jgi:hypothetical protein